VPSPVGHALAGLVVAVAAQPAAMRARMFPPLAMGAMLFAIAPDLDLIYPDGHRVATHSVTAVITVAAVVAVAGWRRFGRVPWRAALVFGGAYGTHVLTDWLGVDTGPPSGLRLWWPWSDRWFISGLAWFRPIERHDPFTLSSVQMNLIAVLQEIAIIGPVLMLVWLLRRVSSAGGHSG
jgi:inner membrane protein